MSKPQKLVVHLHKLRRLFHVSVHNSDTLTSVDWRSVASKSRYAYNIITNGGDPSLARALNGGLMMAFVNTNYEGWETVEIEEVFPNLVRALEHKAELCGFYVAQGYVNVGVRNTSSKRDPSTDGLGSRWNARFNPNRMTMAKVNEKIDWINTSLQMTIPREVRSQALRAVIGEKGNVSSMGELLHFVRSAMGLA